MTEYRFYVTFQSVQRQVFPLNFKGAKLNMERNGDSVYFQRKISGALRFTNIPTESITDYDYFYAIETGTQKCSVIDFEIQSSCDRGETWATYWEGKFGTSDGYWNLDKCYFEVTPKTNGDYEKLLSDISINILEIPTVVTVFAQGTSVPLDRNYTRCRLFSDMLDYLATQTNSNITGIVSNFFQINPSTVSAINYVTQETNTYTQMCVGQKSDIKEPIPSNEATQAPLSFKKCMADLKKLFNVYWTIEGTTIRIEHLSYFATVLGFDLTQAEYAKYVSGKRAYKYISNERPKYETWDLPESSTGARITYDNACGNDSENLSEIKYTITDFYTDFPNIRYGLISNLNGIMLFATAYNGGTGKYDQLGFSRGDELVLGRLVLRFHRHGRPQLNGVLEYFNTESQSINWDKSLRDYGDLLIYSQKKTKQGDDMVIPFCCDKVFNESNHVKTALGNGYVQKAEQSFSNSETLTLTLIYGDTDVAEILPSAITGLQAWYKSDTGVTESPAGVVSAWADQSGNGYTLSQATAGMRPTIVAGQLNGYPAVRFDGVDDGLQSAVNVATFPSKRGTCFVVCKPTAEFGNGLIFGTYDGGVSVSWDISVDQETLAPTQEFAMLSQANEHWKMTQEIGDPFQYGGAGYILFGLRRDSDTEYFGWLNGKQHRETANSNPMPATGQPVSNTLKMGQSFVPGHYYKGDVVEVLLYDRMLTDVERQHVERYLFKRYADLKSYMLV